MRVGRSAAAAARAPWLPFAPAAAPLAARLSATHHHCSMQHGVDEPSSSAGGGHQQHGGGGTGGGGGKHKRHKRQHNPSARPAAAPAADLPLPEGGTHIDGSLLEGGGQILRNASALAAILRKPLKVDQIRAGRDKPGLRPQHLTGLQLVAALCDGELLGGEVESRCITLSPRQLACSHHTADTKTAGSCTLLAQSALPCLLFAGTGQAAVTAGGGSPAAAATAAPAAAGPEPADAAGSDAALQAAVRGGTASELELRGGTDAAMAPPAGYMQHVLLPTLRRRLGIHASMQLVRRGFFPRGQGQVQLTVARLAAGARLPAVDITDRGAVVSIAIRAFTAGRVVPSVGERLADAAHKAIKARLPRCGVPRSAPISLEVVHEPPKRAFSDGCGLLVTAESSTGCLWGASGLGERGVRAEDIGQRAGDELMDALETGACTDEWLQDQLIIFMALAQGRSRLLTGEPTLHTRTACMVAEALTGARFSVAPAAPGDAQPGLWLVECEGAGVAAPP